MPDAITGLTDELLGLTWKSIAACRMWLQRRNATAPMLQCDIVPVAEGSPEVRLQPFKGAHLTYPTGTLTGEAKEAADRGLAASFAQTESPAEPYPFDFETYATQVDDLLQEQNEDPVPDQDLKPCFEAGATPEDAVATIIKARSVALEQDAAEITDPGTFTLASSNAKEKSYTAWSADGVALQSVAHPDSVPGDFDPSSLEEVEVEIADDAVVQADTDVRTAWLRELGELEDVAFDLAEKSESLRMRIAALRGVAQDRR